MALLFFDNFGGYATADIISYWQGYSGATVTSSGGRNNSPYLQITTNDGYVLSKTFAATSTMVVGFGYLTTSAAIATNILKFNDSGTTQATLLMNSDNTLSIVRSTSTAVTSGTSVSSLSGGIWYYIEVKITIDNSIGAGTCEVRVNGATWITVATGQDLQATANATVNQVQFYSTASTTFTRLTDVYIDNGTIFLGDCTVETLTVSGAGTTNTLTTGTFADVDDTTNDGDSTYAESAVSGQLATFAMSNLSGTPTTIHAVAPWNLIRKTDGGTKTARSVIRSGGTNYGQTDFNATDSYLFNAPITIVDPATAVAWVAAGVNAIEVGFEVRS